MCAVRRPGDSRIDVGEPSVLRRSSYLSPLWEVFLPWSILQHIRETRFVQHSYSKSRTSSPERVAAILLLRTQPSVFLSLTPQRTGSIKTQFSSKLCGLTDLPASCGASA